MDSNQPASTPPPYTPPPQQTYAPASAAPGMFGTKIPSAVAFAIAILVFLLPFSEIRCGGQALFEKQGLAFATNNDISKGWKVKGGGMGQDMMKEMDTKKGENEPIAQYLIIAALALGVIGLILVLGDKKPGYQMGTVFGALGAGVLIGFLFVAKKWFNNGMAKQALDKTSDGTDSLGLGKLGDNSFSLGFTPWFYVAVVGFLAAAFFCYKRMSSFKS